MRATAPHQGQCAGCTTTAWHPNDVAYLNARGVSFAILTTGRWDEVTSPPGVRPVVPRRNGPDPVRPRCRLSVSATTTISTSAAAVFAVLADPSRHAAIDGTGRVRKPLDGQRITGSGQIFRVDMYHENHPDGSYEMAKLVLAFEPPRAISWKPGYLSQETGQLEFGGWTWRYDLTQVGPAETKVTLTYDWSAVGPVPRQHIQFPPFPPDHLDNSLSHLAAMVAR